MTGRTFDKALHSKWTAVHPHNGEKHFIVTRIADHKLRTVKLECAVTRSTRIVAFAELAKGDEFVPGWK
ncbi:MAG: TIGR02450 family Trp-rich protein [Spirochaetota bacterium]